MNIFCVFCVVVKSNPTPTPSNNKKEVVIRITAPSTRRLDAEFVEKAAIHALPPGKENSILKPHVNYYAHLHKMIKIRGHRYA